MRHRRSALALAAVLATGAAAAQQPAAPPAQPGGVAVVQTFKGKAVVLFVNYDTRNVTVNINGALHNYTVSDSVKGLSDIHQGDTLSLQVVEALAVYLKKEHQPPVGTAASLMTVAPQGKPAISGVKVTELSGIIAAVNYSTRVVSVAVPKGDTLTFVADTSLHDLHGFKVGDHVAMRYTAAMVVGIDK
jgi:hypothetical protein